MLWVPGGGGILPWKKQGGPWAVSPDDKLALTAGWESMVDLARPEKLLLLLELAGVE